MSLTVESLFGLGEWRQEPLESRRRFGVPPGGPWDREAALLCRALAGAAADAAVFELLHGTVVLRTTELVSLAIVGVSGEIQIEGASRSLNRRIRLDAGSTLRIQAHAAYIATSLLASEAKLDWSAGGPKELRFLPNEPADEIVAVVDPASSRAGVRLNTDSRFESREQPSEPSCVGAIQCTPSGQLIIIGPDGPTIGGYPRVGTVIDADLDLIARLSINREVRLTPTDMASAIQAADAREARFGYLIKGLKLARLA